MSTAVIYVSSTTAYAAFGAYAGDATNGIYVSHNADQTCSAQTWSRVGGAGLASQIRMGRIEMAAAPALVGGQTVLYAGIADANTAIRIRWSGVIEVQTVERHGRSSKGFPIFVWRNARTIL